MGDIVQGTDEWFAARLGKVTASQINDVMMKTSTAGYQNYRSDLICERLTGVAKSFTPSKAMQEGTETEPQARANYTLETGFEVSEVGFVDHPTLAMTGASPDGLVGADGLVEIKCPQPTKHIKTLEGGKIDRNHMLQMHWQMICTGRDWCDFVSFSRAFPPEMQILIQRVPRDAELSAEITTAVTCFLASVDAGCSNLTNLYMKEAA